MKFNTHNKIHILDCWITHTNDSVYKLWVKPAYIKNVICAGIYINDVDVKNVKDDILMGYDTIYEYKGN